MGFLSEGDTLTWEETKNLAKYIQEQGILQFINLWKAHKNREKDDLSWGDELEFIVVVFDKEKKEVKLSLRAVETLNDLENEEKKLIKEKKKIDVSWKPEYGCYMVEATPGEPYRSDPNYLLDVENNMKLRRKILSERLAPHGETMLSLTHFPLMGVNDFTKPHHAPGGQYSDSIFLPDAVINPHNRFGTLTKNIRTRRGRKVDINVPLFIDKETLPLSYESLFPTNGNDSHSPAKHNHVYADSMGFGMGQCCLQVTFQTPSLEDCRSLYDQFAPVTPIMLALTASTPILRGYLTDNDVRWSVIAASVDDRTIDEINGNPDKKIQQISKSRYESISRYLTPGSKKYNDIEMVFNDCAFNKLIEEGVDEELAKHISNLFIRDPLVVYDKRIKLDNEKDTDHFENIQSTNWQTLRFKPPPSVDSKIGWRVEFRPMEISLTESENAAFACFIFLLGRVFAEKKFCLYIPMSKIDENMKAAHKRGAVLNEKFWFKSNINNVDDDSHTKMSINEIINGSKHANVSTETPFPGLLPLVRDYLKSKQINPEVSKRLDEYFDLISKRADGTLQTPATWIREYVTTHPNYKKNSIITNDIAYDLLQTIDKLSRNLISIPSLMGDFKI